MDLRHLEYFMAVADNLHFSRAAEKIGVSQPTLSQQIKVLEEELELPLFDRLGKRIVLTDAGKLLYDQCIGIFQHVRYINDAFAELKNNEGGKLAVSVLPGPVDLMMNHIAGKYHQQHPNVSLSILGSTQVMEQVLSAEVDFGITISPENDTRLISVPLYKDELIVAVAADRPEAKLKNILFQDLQQYQTIMMSRDHACRKLVEDHCKKLGFPFSPNIETSNASSLLQLIRDKVGISIVSHIPVKALALEDIVLVPIADPKPSEEICLIYRKDKFISNAGRSFIRMLNEMVKDLMLIK